MQNTGLHINAKVPYLGASPRGLIQCDCHGKGVLDIKCPYSYRYELKKWQLDKNSPIDENCQVKIDHKYYYQIESQMFIPNLNYCDFFIWPPANFTDYPNYLKIHVEKNDEFTMMMIIIMNNFYTGAAIQLKNINIY